MRRIGAVGFYGMLVCVDGDPAPRPIRRGSHDDPRLTDDELVRRREVWFEMYTAQLNVFAPPRARLYTCPCCGHPTLTERGAYDICVECGWEDDGQDDRPAKPGRCPDRVRALRPRPR